jgi:Kef-type K+ transport system membrane component KefB
VSHLLQVLLLLSVVIAAAKLGGAAANRLGQPAVFGEILIGLIRGPTLLNVLGWPVFREPAAGGGLDSQGPLLGLVQDLADVGVILVR